MKRKRTKKIHKIQLIRRIILAFFIVLITVLAFLHQKSVPGFGPIDALCPFGGLETIYMFLAKGEFISKTFKAEYSDTHEFGLSFEYQVNDPLKTSIGISLTDFGQDTNKIDDLTVEGPLPPFWYYSLGTRYDINDKSTLNFGIIYSIGDSFTNEDPYVPGATQEYSRDVWIVGYGIQHKF